jgi:ABC-type uncharacterized transport system substrate-binding protein
MVYAIKRLALGVGLIVAASAVLLVSDLGRRAPAVRKVPVIAILQHANTPVLDEGVRGLVDGLAARGFRDGDTVTLRPFNAQGDMPTGVMMARQLTAGGYDLVLTASTPSLQALANVNRAGQVRHVFFLVADPFVVGGGLDRARPAEHPPHLTGLGSFPPVDRAFNLARQALPALRRVGVIWNPAESNSAAFVARARTVAKALGIDLLEANVDASSAVADAANSLIARDAQALWMGGDNTVNPAVDLLIATCRRAGIPIFTSLPGKPDRGTLFDLGPDFYQVGLQAAALTADILEGADMARIPIRDVLDVTPPFLAVNLTALDGLRETWAIPEAVRRDANVVVDAGGIHRREPAPAAAAGPAKPRPLSKTWRVDIIELNSVLDVEESRAGVLEGLRAAGLTEGQDYTVSVRNAQGDMATVSGLVDAALTEGADLLVTLSTPTLQAALQRTRTTPIVFTYVANAVAAGAGTSDTSHRPNVTGVYLVGAYDEMLDLVRTTVPKAVTLGTVYVPAEVNSVFHLERQRKATEARGMRILAVAANSPSEVADAALALTAQRVDVICQIPGNLTASAFPSIAQAARQARIPVFAFQTGSVQNGAAAAVARDYHDAGREAGAMAARVMRGESPASMPFVPYTKTRLVVNPEAAAAVGLRLPPAVIQAASTVVGRR